MAATTQPEGAHERADSGTRAPLLCPVSLRVTEIAAMLNGEFADHPVYDGFEVQRFDDDVHGTGMVALLSSRTDQSVDVYAERGLRLDPRMYGIGGGVRSWNQIVVDDALLSVTEDGIAARVSFTDVDGRLIEIALDDRDGHPRTRAAMLAPVGAGIVRPVSLMLVWMTQFDLLRIVAGREPLIRIGGEDVAVGSLPAHRLHRRHLIKYAADLRVIEFNRDSGDSATTGDSVTADDPATIGEPGEITLETTGTAISTMAASAGGHRARVKFSPALPDLRHLEVGEQESGAWSLGVEGDGPTGGRHCLTGGTWKVSRRGDTAVVDLDATRRWRPRRLPLLMRVVTTVLPVFRTWPTTYAWRATVSLADGTAHTRWERTGGNGGAAYRRATGS